MATDNEWGADPAKYKRLSKPFESEEHAQLAAKAFMSDVAKLREKHRIAELTVQFQVYITTETEDRLLFSGGAGWGDQSYQAQLAKQMFDREFDHLCLVVAMLAARTPNVRRMLLTDPKAEDAITERDTEPPSES